ncbi:MAG: hypothetical protein NVS9B14_16250 [Candidatus Acidiferrum sp.]
MAKTSDPKNDPYIMEFLSSKVRFEADGTGSRDLEFQAKIQSESSVREFGVLVYPFAAKFESVDIRFVRVRKPDGSVVETSPGEAQELDSAVSREAPMYTDEREKHLAVKALSVGDTLEVAIHWTVREPMAEGQFWLEHNFHKSGTCKKEVLEFNVPNNRFVKLRYSGITPTVRQDGERKIYTFETSYSKPATESKIPDWEKHFHGLEPPDVGISSFGSWEEVGAWFGKLAEPKVTVTPEIRAKAEELVKDKTTTDDKIRAIYDFVSNRFRYIGIDLGRARYTPHAAADVLANRYGDCKDKHVLFAALLRAAGIPADAALISSSFQIDPNFPSPSLFDHVITAIPKDGSVQFLDTTPEVAPFGLLLPNLRDRNVLLATGDRSGRLLKTPADLAMPSYEIVTIDSTLDAKGTLEAKIRIEDRGDQEIGLRIAYRSTAQNRWEELTQAIMRRLGFAGTVSEVTVTPPEETEKPFVISLSYHRTDFPDWKERRIVFPSPPLLLPELNDAQKASKDPLPLGPLQEVTYKSTVRFPPGFIPVAPEKVLRNTGFAEFSAAYSVQKDTLTGTLHLKTLAREIPGAKRGEFSSLVKLVEDTVSKYIFVQGNVPNLMAGLVGDTKPESLIPKLEEALKQDPDNDMLLMWLSRMYRQDGKASKGVEILEKNIATHTDEVPSHVYLELGRDYLRVPEAEKAMEAFKKALPMDAEPYELNEAAYELAEAKVHLAEALDYSTRAVSAISDETEDIDPRAAGAKEYAQINLLAANWDTLGWIKFEMGDAGGAAKYLAAAWDIWQSATIGEHLVEAYEKLGEQRQAAAICNMASDSVFPSDDPQIKDKLAKEMTRLQPYVKKMPPFPGSTAGRYQQGSVALSDLRMRDIVFPTKLKQQSATAEFTISIRNGEPPVTEALFLSGSEELRGAEKTLAKVGYPHSFPDKNPAQILRRATLTCTVYSKTCTLFLKPAPEAPGSFPRTGGVVVPFQVQPN